MTAYLGLLADMAGLTLLAALSVGLWTVRVAVTAGGRRFVAAAVAGVESLVFVLAMGTVLTSLGEPLRLFAYALGVAGGTLAGIAVDERLSTGQSLVRLIIDGNGDVAVTQLRARGWPATCVHADGVNGPVAVLTVAVEDRVLQRLTGDLDRILPEAFRMTERLREVRPTHLPDGMHQPHQLRRRRRVSQSATNANAAVDVGVSAAARA